MRWARRTARWAACIATALCGLQQAGGQMPKAGASNRVTIRFRAVVDTLPFACGRTYALGRTHTQSEPSDFRLYVHNIRLVNERGAEVPVKLEQDGLWQLDDIALLDFEDGTGPCSNGTPEMHDAVTGSVPAGVYREVRFTVGVPFSRNHEDIARQPPPLTLTQMWWSWRGGHKFLRAELANGMFMHLGSTGCVVESRGDMKPMSCSAPNRPEVSLAGFDPDRSVVIVDFAALFAGSRVDAAGNKTCMSEPRSSACSPFFAALGLSAGRQTGAAQTLFRVSTSAATAGADSR
jgi:uncharacterized repeat protein (TIGR04052 family)